MNLESSARLSWRSVLVVIKNGTLLKLLRQTNFVLFTHFVEDSACSCVGDTLFNLGDLVIIDAWEFGNHVFVVIVIVWLPRTCDQTRKALVVLSMTILVLGLSSLESLVAKRLNGWGVELRLGSSMIKRHFIIITANSNKWRWVSYINKMRL